MVRDHSDSERGSPLYLHGLLFLISSKSSFICSVPQTEYHIPRSLLNQLWSTADRYKVKVQVHPAWTVTVCFLISTCTEPIIVE